MTLDEEGRVPAGMPGEPKPPQLNYAFRSWPNFLDAGADGGMEALIKDAKTVFTARTSSAGEAYSAGETYFLPAKMMPRCGLEKLARAIFELHTSDLIPDEDYDSNISGAEWWTLVLEGRSAVLRGAFACWLPDSFLTRPPPPRSWGRGRFPLGQGLHNRGGWHPRPPSSLHRHLSLQHW